MARRFLMPYRLKRLQRHLDLSSASVLDIGVGNHSATVTKGWFPDCHYYGVDLDRNYNNNQADFDAMEAFYAMDLTRLDFSSIPNQFFDVILLAHVIEHLPNGDQVLTGLLPKLKPGGIIYLEYPSLQSTHLPHMPGTLNFFDDITHCRIYTLNELYNLLMAQGMTVLQGGTRRDWVRVALLPLLILNSLRVFGFISGGCFWDLLGFAEYVVASKATAKDSV